METYLLLSRQASSKHQVQTWALLYWEFHYAKRILETFFVHRCELSTAALPQTKMYQSQQVFVISSLCIHSMSLRARGNPFQYCSHMFAVLDKCFVQSCLKLDLHICHGSFCDTMGSGTVS